jgi:hypothetical protein
VPQSEKLIHPILGWQFLLSLKISNMATNGKPGDNHRQGAVKGRSQVFNPTTEKWVKRDSATGQFMDVKQDGTKFKGLRKEGNQ